MTYFRTSHSSWYQVPVLYAWWDLTASGTVAKESALSTGGHGNGRGNGHSVHSA